MFDLANSLSRWRQEMIEGGVDNPDLLEELSSHLLEAIDEGIHKGYSGEEAFYRAVTNLGGAAELSREFRVERNFMKNDQKTVHGPAENWVRKYAVALFVSGCAIYMSIAAVNLFKVPMDAMMRLLGLAAIIAVPFVGWGCIRGAKMFMFLSNRRLQSFLSLFCLAAGIGSFSFGFPYLLRVVNLTDPQFMIAVLLANLLLMVIVGIGIGMAAGNHDTQNLSVKS